MPAVAQCQNSLKTNKWTSTLRKGTRWRCNQSKRRTRKSPVATSIVSKLYLRIFRWNDADVMWRSGFFQNMRHSRPLFGVNFSLVHCYITFDFNFLTMVIGNRKEEGRVCMHHSIHRSFRKKLTPSKISLSELEKATSVLGFEPGLLRQSATAVQLAPPPRPKFLSYFLAKLKLVSIDGLQYLKSA